ncbi:DUF3253 domain-containing protein [Variovorax ginsengisoli]|uniref:DUF3253 domain-containing protein n=1 Tax=Variovorax ginsengisoli TaxID=363844 RepID=UPI003522DB9D
MSADAAAGDPSPEEDEAIAGAILALLAARAPSASICPSDVARAMVADEKAWRAKMPDVRRVAAQLATQGRVKVTRGKVEVDALSRGGPIRIRRP